MGPAAVWPWCAKAIALVALGCCLGGLGSLLDAGIASRAVRFPADPLPTSIPKSYCDAWTTYGGTYRDC